MIGEQVYSQKQHSGQISITQDSRLVPLNQIPNINCVHPFHLTRKITNKSLSHGDLFRKKKLTVNNISKKKKHQDETKLYALLTINIHQN